MATFFDVLTDKYVDFIRRQHVFFRSNGGR